MVCFKCGEGAHSDLFMLTFVWIANVIPTILQMITTPTVAPMEVESASSANGQAIWQWNVLRNSAQYATE